MFKKPSATSPEQLTLILLRAGSITKYSTLLPQKSFPLLLFLTWLVDFPLKLLIKFEFSSVLSESRVQPFIKTLNVLPLLKMHALISQIPGANIKILVLSFYQKKCYGTVLADQISHGIKLPGFKSPLCHIHLPTIFYEHKV